MKHDPLTPRAHLLIVLGVIYREGAADSEEWVLYCDQHYENRWVAFEPCEDHDQGGWWVLYETSPDTDSTWTRWDYETRAEALNALAARLG